MSLIFRILLPGNDFSDKKCAFQRLMLMKGALSGVYDEAKIADYESQGVALADKDKIKYEEMLARKPIYDCLLQTLKEHISDKVYQEPESLALRTKSWTGNCQISPNLRLYSIGLKP